MTSDLSRSVLRREIPRLQIDELVLHRRSQRVYKSAFALERLVMPFEPEISYDLDKTDAHSVHVPFAARWRSTMKDEGRG